MLTPDQQTEHDRFTKDILGNAITGDEDAQKRLSAMISASPAENRALFKEWCESETERETKDEAAYDARLVQKKAVRAARKIVLAQIARL